MKVRIFDNDGITFDRYTVIIGKDVYSMSQNARSPQGFDSYCGKIKTIKELSMIGKEIKVKDLPNEVRTAIMFRSKKEGK